MARRNASSDALNLPQSTGAIEFDETPEQWGITDDNASTGAVEMPGAITFTQGYLDSPVTVNVATPGPVTVTASFLGDADRKVIEAQHAGVTTKDAEPEAQPEPAPDAEPQPEVA